MRVRLFLDERESDIEADAPPREAEISPISTSPSGRSIDSAIFLRLKKEMFKKGKK